MWKCPVCGKENETLLCAQCGFDGSMDYETHPTLGKVTALALSARKKERDAMLKDYYRCTGCGGRQFYLKKENLQPVCVSCGRVKKLSPAASSAQEVRIESSVIPPVTSVSEQKNLPTSLLPVGYNGNTIAAGSNHTIALRTDGRVVATGKNNRGQCNLSGWMAIVAVAAGNDYSVGLCADGTVVAAGSNDFKQCEVAAWKDTVTVAAGTNHTLGLQADGKVLAVGSNLSGQCNVHSWTDIIAVAAGSDHSVGLKSDGTVVATGSNAYGACNVSGWKDIVAIAAGSCHTVGLRADGIVVATGANQSKQCDVAQWDHVTSIAAGDCFTIGLKSNKTVVVTGGRRAPSEKNILAIAGGGSHIVGLRFNGAMVATGINGHGECNVTSWTNIRLPKNEKVPKKRLGFLPK